MGEFAQANGQSLGARLRWPTTAKRHYALVIPKNAKEIETKAAHDIALIFQADQRSRFSDCRRGCAGGQRQAVYQHWTHATAGTIHVQVEERRPGRGGLCHRGARQERVSVWRQRSRSHARSLFAAGRRPGVPVVFRQARSIPRTWRSSPPVLSSRKFVPVLELRDPYILQHARFQLVAEKQDQYAAGPDSAGLGRKHPLSPHGTHLLRFTSQRNSILPSIRNTMRWSTASGSPASCAIPMKTSSD